MSDTTKTKQEILDIVRKLFIDFDKVDIPDEIEPKDYDKWILAEHIKIVSHALDLMSESVREEAKRENQRVQGLSALLKFIRNKARTDIMKADDYGKGYYEAIKDLEGYFGISSVVDNLIEFREKQK